MIVLGNNPVRINFQMKQRITQALVDGVAPDPDKDIHIGDDGLIGFRLKVTPAGKRIFLFQYRSPGGQQQRKITFGSSDKLTVADARKLATAASNMIRSGVDPQSDSDNRKLMSSLADAVELYRQHHVEPNLKPATVRQYLRVLRTLPDKLRTKKLPDVTRQDLAALVRDMRDTPYQANATHRVLQAFFAWCLGDGGLLDAKAVNPADGVRRYPVTGRSFVFEGDQLFRLADALVQLEKTMWPPAVEAMRLLLLTGMRKEEALQLKWSEVDFDGKRINLEDSKTGARSVPLGRDALALLEKAKTYKAAFGSAYVFPSPKDRTKPIVGFSKMWSKVRTKAGMPNLRVHDLRHNFGGMAAASTGSAVHVKGLLGHTQISTTDRYMKLSEHPLNEAADATNDAITAAMQPKNVVPLKGRAS